MLKKYFCSVIFVVFSLALAGCATNLGIYENYVPQEQLCTLKIDNDIYVHQFDGEDVNGMAFFIKPLVPLSKSPLAVTAS
jgi:hypothetical protein